MVRPRVQRHTSGRLALLDHLRLSQVAGAASISSQDGPATRSSHLIDVLRALRFAAPVTRTDRTGATRLRLAPAKSRKGRHRAYLWPAG